MYSNESRTVAAGDLVDVRNLVYYSLQPARQTQAAAQALIPLRPILPEGWNGVMAPDADCFYILVSNFRGKDNVATVNGLLLNGLSPVFYQPTQITEKGSVTTFKAEQNNSVAQPVRFMIQGSGVTANLLDDTVARIVSNSATTIKVVILPKGNKTPVMSETVSLSKGDIINAYLDKENRVVTEKATSR